MFDLISDNPNKQHADRLQYGIYFLIILNPLHAEIFKGSIKMYLQFIPLLYTDMAWVVEILARVKRELTYFT